MIYDSLDWDIGVTIPAFSRNPSEATQTTMGPESPNLGRLDFCMLGKWIQRNCLGNSEFLGEKYIIQRCWIHRRPRLQNFRTSSTLLTLMKVDRWTWRSFSRRASGNLLDFYQAPFLRQLFFLARKFSSWKQTLRQVMYFVGILMIFNVRMFVESL